MSDEEFTGGELMVKICGVTSESDALLAVGLGADAVGFIFAPSPRQVAATTVADIVKRLPLGVLTVGVFRDEAPSRVVEIANHAGLGAVQLHGHEPAAECVWVRQRVPCTIKVFPAGDRTVSRFPEFGADYLLIDGTSPGSGRVFDWRLAEGVADPSRLIVSGGLTPENVGDAVRFLRPFGVDVATGVEASPGVKDPAKVAAFIAAARQAAGDSARQRADDVPTPPEGTPGDPAPYDWMDQ